MAGWTDYIPDWSSKDALRLCSEYDALSALTAAVNERGSVLPSYTPLTAVNRLYPSQYYIDLIDTKIKSIVPLFVNHTINSGDFTGLNAIPMWTWNDILLGETEASISRLHPVLDWVFQRYAIVNKLKWLRSESVYKNSAYTARQSYDDNYWHDPYASTYSGVITAFTSGEWRDVSRDSSVVASVEYRLDVEASPHYDQYQLYAAQTKIVLLTAADGGGYITQNFACDWYIIPTQEKEFFQPFATITSELLNKHVRVKSNTKQEASIPFYLFDFSEFFLGSNAVIPPPSEDYDKHSVSFFAKLKCSVLKFDIANGFQFKDW